MITRTGVSSGMMPISPEWNADQVYIRYNVSIRQVEDESEIRNEYVYDEIQMHINEYNNVRMGILPISESAWTDQLRIIERSEIYRHADDMIMKYSTDVPDEDKRSAWIAYKAGVRSTQSSQGYPQEVTYPDRPE